VAPSWKLRQRQVEDRRVDAMGCVGHYFVCLCDLSLSTVCELLQESSSVILELPDQKA
jgi:hypothetical protein